MMLTERQIPTYQDYPNYGKTVESFHSIKGRLAHSIVIVGHKNIPNQPFIGFSNHHNPKGLIWEDVVNSALAYDISQERLGVDRKERKVLRFIGKSTLFNPNLSPDQLFANKLFSIAPYAGKLVTRKTLGIVKRITDLDLDTLDFNHILAEGLASLPIDRPKDLPNGAFPDIAKIKAIYEAAKTSNLQIFPEGQVSHPADGELLDFEEGAFRIARASKNPLLPSSLVYGNNGPSGIVGQDLLIAYDEPFDLDEKRIDVESVQKSMQEQLKKNRELFTEIFGYKPGEQPRGTILKKYF